mgnify:CR=1 FL=1
MKLRRFAQIIVGLGVGVGLLYWVLQDYSWEAFREVSWRWEWFGGAAIVMALAHGFRAWRWKLFLKANVHTHVSFWEAFMALMAGYLVNLGIPRAGEIVRCSLLYRARKLPLEVSFGTVVGERLLDILLLGICGSVVLAVEGSEWLRRLGLGRWAPFLISGAVLGVGLLWGLYRYRERLPWAWLQRLVKGIVSAFTVRPRSVNLLFSVSIWVCYWIATWMAGLAVESGFSLWEAWVLLAGSGLAMAIPVPGGLGTFHAIGFTLLAYSGYSESQAKTIIILIYAFQILHTILLGLIGIAYFSFQRTTSAKPVSSHS